MTTDIDAVWESLLSPGWVAELDQTTFLLRCRAGSISGRELDVFLVQHYHYGKHFTRYLCALLANLTEQADRNALIQNLFEEMGYGDAEGEPHSELYRNMLASLDIDPDASLSLPETEVLIGTMLRLCSDANPMVGLGALCLGAEAIVPHVYSQIMQGLGACAYPQEHLRFFALHINGDEEHALSMKAIIDRELQKTPEAANALLHSAQEIIGARVAFFEAICQHAARSDARQEAAYAI